MRILQLVQKPQRRGAEVFAFELAAEVRRRGHVVRTVYLYPFEGNKSLPVHGADRVLGGRENHVLERLPGIHPRLLNRVMEQIKEFAPDVVQVNGARSVKYGAMARRLAGRRAAWRLVYRNIGDPRVWNRQRLRVAVYKRLFMSQVDGVVGVSRATLASAIEIYGLRVPSVCLPGGIDTNGLRPSEGREAARGRMGVGAADRVIVYVGGLEREKRPDRLLRAIARARVAAPNLQVWLVGDGAMREELQSLAQDLRIESAVRLLGYQEHVADYLAAADLFALTSDTEGTPAVVLEAGYMGLPTVATRVGGLGECVVAGETGLLCDREDEAGLAAAFTRLALDDTERRAMGAAARKWVSGRFTLEKVAGDYEAFYKRVLDNQQRLCSAKTETVARCAAAHERKDFSLESS